MADWPNQIAEFQRQWVNQQQKLLTDWLETLQRTGADTPSNIWRGAVDVMERQINSALDTQKRSLMKLAANTRQVEGVPEALIQPIHQLEKGIELWTQVQQRLWKTWFETLRTTAPAAETPDQTLIRNWQEMARQAMSIQEEWLSHWTGSQKASGGAPGKKSAQPSTSRKPSKTKGGNEDKD